MPVIRAVNRRPIPAYDRPPIRIPGGPYRDWALFLDIDGTLLDLAGHPRDARSPAGLPELLDTLWRGFDGALALCTGRSLEDLDHLLALPHVPAVAEYGATIRLRDRVINHAHGGEHCLEAVLRAIRPALDKSGDAELTVKSHGFVLSFAGGIALDDPLNQLLVEAVAPHGHMLRIIHARNVVEVRCAGINYGNAIERVWCDEPWIGRRPVFIGDDLPDLAGFAAARRRRGHAIAVGPGIGPCELALPDPTQLRAWLSYVAEGLALERRGERDRRSAFLGMPPLNLRPARPQHWHGAYAAVPAILAGDDQKLGPVHPLLRSAARG